MKTATWLRDSHSLFDYESNQILKKSFSTHQSRNVIRMRSGEVFLVSDKELARAGPEATLLFKITPKTIYQSNPSYIIQNSSKTDVYEDPNDKLWLIIRSLKTNDIKEEYKLKRNEILKLGRMKLKVKEYRLENAASEEDKVNK